MPDENLKVIPEATPVFGISIQMAVSDRCQLVFQTHVDRDAPTAQLNDVLDRAFVAADRRAAISELERLETDQRDVSAAMDRLTGDLHELDQRAQDAYAKANKHGPWAPDKLPNAERAARQNVVAGLEKHKEHMKRMAERASVLKAKVNGHAPDGAGALHSG